MVTIIFIIKLFVVFSLAYGCFLFFMMGANSHEKYQIKRKGLENNLNFSKSDGVYFFFAFIFGVGLLQSIYQLIY